MNNVDSCCLYRCRQARLDPVGDDLTTVYLSTRSIQDPTSSRTSPTPLPSTQPSKSLHPVARLMEPLVPLIPPHALPSPPRVRQLLPLAPSRSPSFGNQPRHSQVSSLLFFKALIDLLLYGRSYPRRTKQTTGSQARRPRRKGRLRLEGHSALEWILPSGFWKRTARC